MTEAMPFLQKAILLSYDPRPLPKAFMAKSNQTEQNHGKSKQK